MCFSKKLHLLLFRNFNTTLVTNYLLHTYSSWRNTQDIQAVHDTQDRQFRLSWFFLERVLSTPFSHSLQMPGMKDGCYSHQSLIYNLCWLTTWWTVVSQWGTSHGCSSILQYYFEVKYLCVMWFLDCFIVIALKTEAMSERNSDLFLCLGLPGH